MESEASNDWKRVLSVLSIIVSISLLGILAFTPSNSNAVTGAATSLGSGSGSTIPWIFGLAAVIFLIIGGITLYKVNQ